MPEGVSYFFSMLFKALYHLTSCGRLWRVPTCNISHFHVSMPLKVLSHTGYGLGHWDISKCDASEVLKNILTWHLHSGNLLALWGPCGLHRKNTKANFLQDGRPHEVMSVILGEGFRCVSKAILEHPSLAKLAQTKRDTQMTHRVMNEWLKWWLF